MVVPVRMQGMSLIELLVALAISLVIVGAVGYVYVGGLQAYRTQEALSRLQEGARYAFEVISKDVRMAGSTGCGFSTNANVLNTSPLAWNEDLVGLPLQGTNDAAPPGACVTAGTSPCYIRGDSLAVLMVANSPESIVQSHNTATAQITLDTVAAFSAGGLAVANDCTHVAVFEVSSVDALAKEIEHAMGGRNSTINLGAAGAPYTFPADSRVFPLYATAYYIGTNPAGEPALYRRNTAAEELVEGVEDLQVVYGVDTDATADGEVNEYHRADEITNGACVAGTTCTTAAPGVAPQDRWARVISVKISLLMRTTEDGVVASPQTYSFNGANVLAADRRLRRVISHVVKVRNR